MLSIAILVFSVLASAGTGFFVVARNSRSTVNRVYGLLTLSLVVLSIANYFSLATTNRLIYIRAVIACSNVLVASLYYLIFYLGSKNARLSSLQKAGVYATVGIFFLDFTPVVFSGLQGTTNPTPVPSIGAILFFVHLVSFLVFGVWSLFRRIRESRGILRQQYIYMLTGVMPILLFSPITGVILPILLKRTDFISITPLYGAFFVCLIGYSIVRHKLFDIQFFVVRAAAYASTLFVITFIFVTPFVFVVSHYIGRYLSTEQSIAVVSLSVVFLYALQALRRIFDRWTSAIFFRHYYDPQDVLDKLSDILVRTPELHQLEQSTASVLQEALKPQSFRYVLFTNLVSKDKDAVAKLRAFAQGANDAIIDVDDPLDVSKNFVTWLRDEGITLAAKLRTTHEDLGYILLGHKQSGELYSDRDKRLLSVAADEIAISMQNALRFEQIQRFNVTLQEEVDSATSKLRRTNRRLEELDNIKDDFISMASHQLRTPLTSVKGYISMVLEGDAGKLNGTQTQMLKQAFASSQRMVFLITDLLNVSRLKTGKFVIDVAPVRLGDVVSEEIEQLKETAQVKNVELTSVVDKPFPILMLDEVKIRQVIMNFVDNAIYYTQAGGHINVELIDKPSTIEMRVTDDGIGVPKGEQHHLFSKFYRATNARKARPDGTGLGLFMAQKVILAQGGSVIFSSVENKGSTFGFSFSKSRLVVPDGSTNNQPVKSPLKVKEPAVTK